MGVEYIFEETVLHTIKKKLFEYWENLLFYGQNLFI